MSMLDDTSTNVNGNLERFSESPPPSTTSAQQEWQDEEHHSWVQCEDFRAPTSSRWPWVHHLHHRSSRQRLRDEQLAHDVLDEGSRSLARVFPTHAAAASVSVELRSVPKMVDDEQLPKDDNRH